MAGRPKKPAALKKLEGTYRKDRDGDRELQEQKLASVLPSGSLKVPKSITDPMVRKAYKNHIELLRSLGEAAEQKADSPLLEKAYVCLEKANMALRGMQDVSMLDDEYQKLENSYFKNLNKFESIVKEFYLTPTARAKLKLDALTATEKQLNITEKKSAVASLLEKKES